MTQPVAPAAGPHVPPGSPPRTGYRIAWDAPGDHRLDVELRLSAVHPSELDGGTLCLRMASWTPGSYLLREYSRHVEQVRAFGAAGEPLAVTKSDKRTWCIQLGTQPELTVRYRVYAHELTVRTAHVDDSHAFWNAACVALYAESRKDEPCTVEVAPPAAWIGERLRVDTALPSAPPTSPPVAHRFVARDLDELLDSPFEVGHHAAHEFVAAGRPHRIAVWDGTPRVGPTLPYDADRLCADVATIIEQAAAVFGKAVPYDDYLFVLHLAPRQRGGLEHKACSVLLETPAAFQNRKRYLELLELFAHEYFHLWNVKRLRPQALGPFHYGAECYTRSLWAMEGITSYYDRLLVYRAGLMTSAEYLAGLGEDLARLRRTPGRRLQSLEEASFDAWIKLYRPDENTVNSTVSYYLKGSLVAAALDLEIRHRTEHHRSLDTVMSALFERLGASPTGFDDEQLQGLMERACGLDLSDFFARYVRGTEELELERCLEAEGLSVAPGWEPQPPPAKAGPVERPVPKGPSATLGVLTRSEYGRLLVAAVLDDGPALSAGLAHGDELVAIDGWRIGADDKSLTELLAERAAGQRVTVTLFRRDRQRQVEVTLAERPPDRYHIEPVPGGRRNPLDGWLKRSA